MDQTPQSSGAVSAGLNQSVLQLVDDLISGWDEHSCTTVHVSRRRPKGRSRSTAALADIAAAGTVALVAHGFELARLIRPVMPGGITYAHAPTVRAILENTAVVYWLTTTPGAGEQWMEAIRRSRQLLSKDMTKSAIWEQHASAIPDADDDQAKRRDELLARCAALPGDQHVVYRALSGRAHPTATIAAFYIPDQGDGSLRLVPRPPAPADSNEFTVRIARWLLWNHQAIDPYQGSPARQQLQRIGRQLQDLDVPAGHRDLTPYGRSPRLRSVNTAGRLR